jgi:hypothetical protein
MACPHASCGDPPPASPGLHVALGAHRVWCILGLAREPDEPRLVETTPSAAAAADADGAWSTAAASGWGQEATASAEWGEDTGSAGTFEGGLAHALDHALGGDDLDDDLDALFAKRDRAEGQTQGPAALAAGPTVAPAQRPPLTSSRTGFMAQYLSVYPACACPPHMAAPSPFPSLPLFLCLARLCPG